MLQGLLPIADYKDLWLFSGSPLGGTNIRRYSRSSHLAHQQTPAAIILRGFAEEFLQSYNGEYYDCIIVDEVQFLAPEIIDKLSDLVDTNGITVICYGLRTDFRSELFPGAKRLMELADDIEQIKTICWCGKRAHFNARILNGQMVTEGEQVQLGGNESYTSLCRKHYKERQIKPQK